MKNKFLVRLSLIILLLLLVVIACTPQATQSPRVVTVVVSATPEPTVTPTLFVTATVKPIRTPLPTYTPEPPWLPPPTQAPFVLTGGNPSDWDITRFILDQHLPYLRSFYNPAKPNEHSDFQRQDLDVNDDGHLETVIKGYDDNSGEAFLGIVRYDRSTNLWHDMFFLEEYTHQICHNMRTTVESDHIVIDSFSCDFGSAFDGYQWWQTWIKCDEEKCEKVWSAQLLESSQYHPKEFPCSGYYLYGEIERPNNKIIQFTIHRFGIDGISCYKTPLGMVRRVVGPEIIETYEWSGSQYSLASREQIKSGIEIAREFDQATEETKHTVVDILLRQKDPRDPNDINLHQFWGVPSPDSAESSNWKSEFYAPVLEVAAQNDKTGHKYAGIVVATNKQICRLTVQQYESSDFTLIGRKDVPCTSNFTRLFWVDVDADGEDELLLLTIVAGSDQRQLYIYRVDNQLIEIANITGVINGEDGVGIRWENTPEGFRLFVGLPFAYTIPPDCPIDWSFSCASLSRRFQTYRWDKASSKFVPVDK